MKDSGVAWLGEIPSHWNVKRLKFLARKPLMYGANEAADDDNPDNPRYVRITDINENGSLRNDTFRSLPYEIAAPYLLEKGDILFARSGSVGRTFLYQKSWGQVCFAGYLIKFSTEFKHAHPEYVDCFTSSQHYWEWVNNISIQTTIQNVSAEKYANLFVPLPPLAEQRAIAAYLDRETAKIDALIARTEELNALLGEKRTALISHVVNKGLDPAVELKDSGVEWLGEIPSHWEVKRFKYLATVRTGQVDPTQNAYRQCRLLAPNHIQSGTGLLFETSSAEDQGAQSGKVPFKTGDVLYSKIRPNLHKVCLAPFDGICSSDIYPIVPIPQIAANFLLYTMLTTGFHQLTVLDVMGATIPRIDHESLMQISFPLPTLAEQRAIAAHLDRETARIDALFAKNKQLIALLREKRTALISAAVTGKIDLRNEA